MSAFVQSLQIRPVQTIKDHKRAISKVSFSPSGRVLASSSADSYLNLYTSEEDTNTANKWHKRGTLRGHAKGISDFVWSSNSNYICSCSDNQLIVMWDVIKSQAIQLFPTPNTLKVECSTSMLTNCNSALFLYDVFIENQISSLSSFEFTLQSPSLQSNNNNNNNNKSRSISATHNHYILCLALNQQANIMASGSFDETVILWDVRSAKHIKILSAHSDPVCCLSFCADGTMLLSAGYDGLIRGWDMSSMRCIKTLGFDPTAVSFAKWTPNGQYIISGTLDSTIRLWDFQTAKMVKTYKGHKNEQFGLFSDFMSIPKLNANCIACGSEDGYIYFWDIQTKRILHKFKAHNDVVLAIDFQKNVNDHSLVFASGALQNDHSLKIWQIL